MYKDIIVALDGSEPSDHALRTAAELAKATGAKLTLLHVLLRSAPLEKLYDMIKKYDLPAAIKKKLDDVQVIVPTTAYGASTAMASIGVDGETLGQLAEAYLDRTEQKANELGVTVTAKAICDGNPADQILSYSQEKGADLIVLGSRGMGDIKSLFLGSVSHRIAQESTIPCLITK